MKFDIFNENTWLPEAVNIEKQIRNKALGSIGQMVYQLRQLKEKLEKHNHMDTNEELQIASRLKPDTYRIMQIEIIHSGGQIANTLQNINKVLDFWKDTSARELNWRGILPTLTQIKPYLDGNNYDEDLYRELVTTKVTGNAAWEAYLGMALDNIRNRKTIETLRKRQGTITDFDESPESSDDWNGD